MELDAGSYGIAREHEEFLARVYAWGEEVAPSRRRRRPTARATSPLESLALGVLTLLCAAAAASLATPLDEWSAGWSLGFGSFAAGVAAGTIAVRLGGKRPALAAATASTLCFVAMFVALLVATV